MPMPMPMPTHMHPCKCLPTVPLPGRLFRLREACGVRDISTLCSRFQSCPRSPDYSCLWSAYRCCSTICSALASPQTHSRRPALAHAAQFILTSAELSLDSVDLSSTRTSHRAACAFGPPLDSSILPLSLFRARALSLSNPLLARCPSAWPPAALPVHHHQHHHHHYTPAPAAAVAAARLLPSLPLAPSRVRPSASLEGTTSLVLKTSSDLHPEASSCRLGLCTLNLPPVVPAFFFASSFLHPALIAPRLGCPRQPAIRKKKKKKENQKRKKPPDCPATPPPVSKAGSLAPASSVCASSTLASIPTSSAAAFF
ncbi:hypothetical protein BKA80DRAFT_36984 [Phyllosticta citrichinensis]